MAVGQTQQDASASSTEEREMHDDQGPEEEAGARSQEQKQEVLSLRARSAELEERLAAARARAALARERREFMEDEAEQVRHCFCMHFLVGCTGI